jgi:tRNA 2-thiocytidine biosynthesis protein TtcA
MAYKHMTALHRHLRKYFEKAILDYSMFQKGDRVLVAVSGGADSLALLHLFNSPKVEIPSDISFVAVHLDLGFNHQNDYHWRRLERHFHMMGCEYAMEKTDIGIKAHDPLNRKNPCFICSRQRRKRLFEIANRFNCNKLALGHHKDDIIETFLLNVFFSREISTMLPVQEVFSGKFHIVRPLVYIDEQSLKIFARESLLPVMANACPTNRESHRTVVKQLLTKLERDHRGVRNNIFRALSHVKTEYLFTQPLRRMF